MGTLGAIFTSFDGENWTRATIPSEFNDLTNIDSIVYTGSRWIAFARVDTSSNAAVITTDVVSFTRIAMPNVQEVFYAAFGNSTVVGSGHLGFVVSADEGQTWQEIAYADPSNSLPPLAFGNGVFLAAQSISHNSGDITVQQSEDGLTWNNVGSIHLTVLGNMVFVNGLFYLMGNDDDGHPAIWSSTDGAAWTYTQISADPLPGGGSLTGMAYGNGTYVLIPTAENTPCYTSADGTTFSSSGTLPGAFGAIYVKVIFANSLFVAVTQQTGFVLSRGTISFSADNGASWQSTVVTDSSNASLYDIVSP